MALTAIDNGFSLQGAVNFSNVVALRFEGERWIVASNQSPIAIDLSLAKDQDASILSLLLCWSRCAKSHGKELKILQASSSFQRMQKLFGLKIYG